MRRLNLALATALLVLSQGCSYTLSESIWLPGMSGKQEAGTTTDVVDLDDTLSLGLEPAMILVHEITTQSDAGQRSRIRYWRAHAEGSRNVAVADAFDFSDLNFSGNVESTMDFESIGVAWEPGFQRGSVRLGLAFGLDLLNFKMNVDDGVDVADIEFPDPNSAIGDAGITYAPVIVGGLNLEIGVKEWLVVICQFEMFDSEITPIFEKISAKYRKADVGVAFGKPTSKGVKAFAGYRYFMVEYGYELDSGDTTLSGLIASVSLRF